MTSPYFLAISGNFKIVGYEPDGDSVRFIADQPDHWKLLKNHFRIKLSSLNGSVQLRFDAIDAPELHYGGEAQPQGAEARDTLLSAMGFKKVSYGGPTGTLVQSSKPATVPGFILSQMAEANGRPVSYVLVGSGAKGLRDGTYTNVTEPLLRKTLNARMLENGAAYITIYTSSPVQHQAVLRTIATGARSGGLGVWAADATSLFDLVTQASISPPSGALILPKLFRRATDYLKDVTTKGFHGNLADWIRAMSTGSRNENDRVHVTASLTVGLADLLEQRNKAVAFLADPIAITFVEK